MENNKISWRDFAEEARKKKNARIPEKPSKDPPVDELSAPEICHAKDDGNIIQRIKAYKIEGNRQKLYRIDDSALLLLEQLRPCLGITETAFINYLIHAFFDANPQIKTIIKNKIKKL